jgi:site-specific recombinase XerD
MRLYDLVEQYIAFRQAFGAVFRSEAYSLRRFARLVGPDVSVADVRRDQVSAFLAGNGTAGRSWHVNYGTLSVFFRYAISRGHLTVSPLPPVIPKAPPRFVPYIYSQEELHRLLQATTSYQRIANAMEPVTARTLLLVLYAAGLRVSEALALDGRDVDLRGGVLRIRRTKFFKERLVPVGPGLIQALVQYAERPRRRTRSCSDERPFLASRTGVRLRLATVQGAFERIRREANVCRQDGGRFQPRLHDLRHTFAVNCLTEWYRTGADVQKLLPYLSTYLGHKHLSGTQFYLSMTRELLHQACERFERSFLETGDDQTH